MWTLSDCKVRHGTLSYLEAINLFLGMLQLVRPPLPVCTQLQGPEGAVTCLQQEFQLQENLTKYSVLPFT